MGIVGNIFKFNVGIAKYNGNGLSANKSSNDKFIPGIFGNISDNDNPKKFTIGRNNALNIPKN